MLALFLLALAGAVFYVGSLYAWPFRSCPRCGGTGRNRGSNARRFGQCKRRGCNGGRVQRTGSRTVHQAVRALADYRNREKP